MAANIKAQGARESQTTQFADDSLAAADSAPLKAGSVVASTSGTVPTVSSLGDQTHTSTFEEPSQSSADETVGPESEVAAFRDGKTKSG